MGNKKPKSIFTDEDKTMSKAIEILFQESRRPLCTWHIAKNATQHLASYYANADFKKQFNKCFHGCYSEIEFEVSWDDMIKKFNLEIIHGLKNCIDYEKSGVLLLVWILF